jgi:CHASE2 domain-containing sensor protein/signal transduction histidine kinase
VLREWIILAIALCTAAAFCWNGQWLWRLDLALYDATLATKERAPPADVVIVAIDERSLATVGRWPWGRRLQATLIDRLTEAGVRAIGYDVILAEPDRADPGADEVLAMAIRRSGRVVLPAFAEGPAGALRRVMPLPAIAAAARAVGHPNVEIDADGLVRGVYLREGPVRADLDHMALGILRAAGEGIGALPGTRRPPGTSQPGYWQRDHAFRIAFSGPPGHFSTVSAADVLAGNVSGALLQDRIVLVGTTAIGLGDGYAVPGSGLSRLMPGVEINASVLDTLRRGIDVRDVDRTTGTVLAVLPVAALLFAYLWLRPRAALLASGGAVGATICLAVVAPQAGLPWFPPAATIAALVLCYPVWSWRRLEVTLRFMERELARLRAEPDFLPTGASATQPPPRFAPESIEQGTASIRHAIGRLRTLRGFLEDSLQSQSGGVLVALPDGRIVFHNRNAGFLLGMDAAAITGQPLARVLATIRRTAGASVEVHGAGGDTADRFEGETRGARALLVDTVHCHGIGYGLVATITNLTDISAIREAQRAREDALAFLSHDLKAPQASILSAVELRRSAPGELSETAMLEHVEQTVRRALSLAEAFVLLTRAEQIDRRSLAVVDLCDVAAEVTDEAWPLAARKQVTIMRSFPDTEVAVTGDRPLLGAAILNLLANAVRFSPQGSTVRVGIEVCGTDVLVSVRDEGPGIQEHVQATLFSRFQRADSVAGRSSRGTGLGLAIVATVAQRHDGHVTVESRPGHGATFLLRLPLAGHGPSGAESA